MNLGGFETNADPASVRGIGRAGRGGPAGAAALPAEGARQHRTLVVLRVRHDA